MSLFKLLAMIAISAVYNSARGAWRRFIGMFGVVAIMLLVCSVADACNKCGYSKCSGTCYAPAGSQYYGVYATEEGAPPNVRVRYWKGGVEYVKVKQQCTKDKDHETGWCYRFIPKQEYTTYTASASYVPYAQQGSTVYGTVNETQTYGQPTYQSYAAAYTTDPASFMNQAFRLVTQSQSLAQQGQADYTANATALNSQALANEGRQAVIQGYLATIAATKTTPDTVNRTTTFQASTGPVAEQIQQPQFQAQVQQGSVTVAKCASCHSTNPKAQAAMSFDNLAALTADQRMQAINAIVENRMPKAPSQPLTPVDAEAIVRELSRQPVAAGEKF